MHFSVGTRKGYSIWLIAGRSLHCLKYMLTTENLWSVVKDIFDSFWDQLT